jgi:hypothetical protein
MVHPGMQTSLTFINPLVGAEILGLLSELVVMGQTEEVMLALEPRMIIIKQVVEGLEQVVPAEME